MQTVETTTSSPNRTNALISGSFICLEINKSNTKLIAENSQVCYIIGLGKTNYTIHRDADEIKDFYFPKHNRFVNWSVNLMHNYHVFQSRLKSICGSIKFRKSFKHKGKVVNIKRAFIGIPNYCEIGYKEGGRRSIDAIYSIGSDYTDSNERLMYIIEVAKIETFTSRQFEHEIFADSLKDAQKLADEMFDYSKLKTFKIN